MNDLARDMMRTRMADRRSGRQGGGRGGRSRGGRDSRYEEMRDRAYDRAMRDMARSGGRGSRGGRGGDRASDMGYDPTEDETYDMAYQDGFADGMNEGFHNELTPYGSRGMTVSDGRQGVRGTGRYGRGGSMYRGRRDRDSGEEEMYLDEEDMKEWKKMLKNADGTMGEHFDKHEVEQAAKSLGIMPQEYTMEDLCMVANMLYSDYCDTFKNIIPKDKEVKYYTKMAEDFLDDKDSSVKGSEKLATYYYCIVSEE